VGKTRCVDLAHAFQLLDEPARLFGAFKAPLGLTAAGVRGLGCNWRRPRRVGVPCEQLFGLRARPFGLDDQAARLFGEASFLGGGTHLLRLEACSGQPVRFFLTAAFRGPRRLGCAPFRFRRPVRSLRLLACGLLARRPGLAFGLALGGVSWLRCRLGLGGSGRCRLRLGRRTLGVAGEPLRHLVRRLVGVCRGR